MTPEDLAEKLSALINTAHIPNMNAEVLPDTKHVIGVEVDDELFFIEVQAS